jgi:hypothetical protein
VPIKENDLAKKFKYDNQVLMRRLTDYKRAEKGAAEIVKDYASIKKKYEDVLEDNIKTKRALKELMNK